MKLAAAGLLLLLGLALTAFSFLYIGSSGCRPGMEPCGPSVTGLAGLAGLALIVLAVITVILRRRPR